MIVNSDGMYILALCIFFFLPWQRLTMVLSEMVQQFFILFEIFFQLLLAAEKQKSSCMLNNQIAVRDNLWHSHAAGHG